jgi:3-deoxy-manno-octulosonate cytidylyltransferase (CMP-KDO synthetase)
MSFIVVIPARFSSTRLPGKPLQDIAGKPMIQHVWEQASKSAASAVVIATDHQGIHDVATAFGANVCMTSDKHESGTDRLQEVVKKLAYDNQQVVVNVQGDEPLIPPAVINQVAGLMQHEIQMATLFEIIHNAEQVFDPNVVKIVSDDNNDALYFSRAPMPWYRDGFANDKHAIPTLVQYKRHIGIYAYRVKLLHQFVQWPMSNLESVEKLEQLRALSNGIRIRIAEACETIPPGVDTQKDLDHVRSLLKQ